MAGYEDAAVKVETSLAMMNIGQMCIIGVAQGAVMLMAAFSLARGQSTIGDFVLINTLMIQLFMPLGQLGWVYRQTKQSLVDMERMFSLLDVAPEIADRPGAGVLVPKGGAVTFENVSFHYEPARSILKDVSFTVPAGATVGIVGPSGAGKSTLSRLLFRFYDVTGGRILIDGEDIRDVTQESLRQAIGIVPQDTVLFNDTIRYNIRYGRPGASDEEVAEAAKVARIHGLVEHLPKGYETVVGERGLKLSGGEKQRVAIARMVLKNPPILVLDEATSALDSETEAAIQKELDIVCAGRTALVIAHRLSTVIHADEILVLDGGEITERGTHKALLAKGGQYAQMWAQQQRAAREARRQDRADEEEVAVFYGEGRR
jgi:ATP-binding cassette subfamily B protein